MPHIVKSAAKAAAAAVLLVGAAAPSAFALTNSFNQNWVNLTQSGRYRAHAGTHSISAYAGCGAGLSEYVDLRVDVINNPDVSEGKRYVPCGGTIGFPGIYDSYAASDRGHFMQNLVYSWTGIWRDTHSG